MPWRNLQRLKLFGGFITDQHALLFSPGTTRMGFISYLIVYCVVRILCTYLFGYQSSLWERCRQSIDLATNHLTSSPPHFPPLASCMTREEPGTLSN